MSFAIIYVNVKNIIKPSFIFFVMLKKLACSFGSNYILMVSKLRKVFDANNFYNNKIKNFLEVRASYKNIFNHNHLIMDGTVVHSRIQFYCCARILRNSFLAEATSL